MKQAKSNLSCPIEKTLKMIVGKWKTVILWHLSSGKKRYSALKRLIPGISEKMLVQALRSLERDALIHRKVYPEVPPHVEYMLSKRGKSLSPLICALNTWGKKHR